MSGLFHFLVMRNNKFGIHDLSEEDRPREKFLEKGNHSLSNTELIAILIGSGNKDQNAIKLAQEILHSANNNLNELARFSIQDLMKFRGIGEAKAINIASALEIGRRRQTSTPSKKTKISCAKDAYQHIKPMLQDLQHEEFWILCLNRSNQVLKNIQISSGGISGTTADPKIIFKKALDQSASSIILIHNHPSGNPTPSKSDEMLTEKLSSAGNYLDIPVLDHLIFCNDRYYSFSDENKMK